MVNLCPRHRPQSSIRLGGRHNQAWQQRWRKILQVLRVALAVRVQVERGRHPYAPELTSWRLSSLQLKSARMQFFIIVVKKQVFPDLSIALEIWLGEATTWAPCCTPTYPWCTEGTCKSLSYKSPRPTDSSPYFIIEPLSPDLSTAVACWHHDSSVTEWPNVRGQYDIKWYISIIRILHQHNLIPPTPRASLSLYNGLVYEMQQFFELVRFIVTDRIFCLL
jgi:hypothetical protein